MNRNEIDYLSQSLVNKYFIANVILKHIGNTRVNRCTGQQQGQAVHIVPLIFDITCSCIILFWVLLLGGTFLLSLFGLFLLVFYID